MTVSLEDFDHADVVEVPTRLHEMLDREEEERLRANLERIAETRRQAATEGASLRLS